MLIKYKNILSIILLVITIQGCIEPYENNIKNFDDVLVIQGLITNELGPYKVILSRAINVNSDTLVFETGAIVSITDKFNNLILLEEQYDGHYFTPPAFQGQVNNEYQLSVKTIDNKEYISTPVRLIQGPEIDTLYTTYSENYNFDENKVLRGIDIVADSKEWDFEGSESFYLKWDYEETWEVEQLWNAREIKWADINDVEFFDYDNTPRSCWNIKPSYDIILADPNDYSSNIISNKKILHINELETKPYYGYSILVNQYIINESAYNFWNVLKENNIDNGSVFDNIPSNAVSNIECCNGEDKVYGYFDAVYKSKKRLSLKPPIHDIEFVDINERCKLYEWSLSPYLDSMRNITTWALEVNEERFSIRFTLHEFCTDCMVVANSDVEPDYWIYK